MKSIENPIKYTLIKIITYILGSNPDFSGLQNVTTSPNLRERPIVRTRLAFLKKVCSHS